MMYIKNGFKPKFFFRKENSMLKSLFASLFTKVAVYSKAVAIRGTYSSGSQDRPGIWYK